MPTLFLALADDPKSYVLPVFFFLCALLFFGAIRRAIVLGRLTKKIFFTGFGACAVPLGIVLVSLFPPPLNLTPEISDSSDLIGKYVNPKRTIELLGDGTYVASGFKDFEGGTWSHDGWDLELTGSGFSAARIVKRGDGFFIAPYFDPEFDRLGPTLKKR